jgi:hypothetical protein
VLCIQHKVVEPVDLSVSRTAAAAVGAVRADTTTGLARTLRQAHKREQLQENSSPTVARAKGDARWGGRGINGLTNRTTCPRSCDATRPPHSARRACPQTQGRCARRGGDSAGPRALRVRLRAGRSQPSVDSPARAPSSPPGVHAILMFDHTPQQRPAVRCLTAGAERHGRGIHPTGRTARFRDPRLVHSSRAAPVHSRRAAGDLPSPIDHGLKRQRVLARAWARLNSPRCLTQGSGSVNKSRLPSWPALRQPPGRWGGAGQGQG